MKGERDRWIKGETDRLTDRVSLCDVMGFMLHLFMNRGGVRECFRLRGNYDLKHESHAVIPFYSSCPIQTVKEEKDKKIPP